MRVSINAHYLHRKMSGLARYARQIHAVLLADGHQIVEVQPPGWFYREGGRIRKILRFLALATCELLVPPLILLLRRADYHISPAFAAPLGLVSRRHLVVVHDLAFIDYPELYSRLERLYLRLNLRILQIGRHQIIAPSEFVKAQICRIYGISAHRVHTISPYSEFKAKTVPMSQSDRYFVLLCNAHPRKNLQATLEGFLASQPCADGYRLLVVGNFEKTVHADAGQVLVCKGVSDEQLQTMIAGASAMVLFSLSEGFGFPVVEAASLGVVSLTSGVSSLAELSAPGAPVSVATNPAEIKSKFDQFLADASYRARLEQDRQFVNATFSREAFDQRWRELLCEQ